MLGYPIKTILVSILIFMLGVVSSVFLTILYFKISGKNPEMNYANTNTNSVNVDINKPIVKNEETKQNFEMNYIVGEIISLSGNKLNIKINPALNPIFKDKGESVVGVTVTDMTKFVSMVQKDATIFKKELLDFQKIPIANRDFSMSPQPFLEKETSRDLFTIGKMVVVKSKEKISSSASSINAESVGIAPEIPKATSR